MNTKLNTLPAPVRGPDAKDREAWVAARANGITATDVRDAAKGTSSDRRRIIAEKVTGDTKDLAGNRFIDWGHEREPIIMDWVRRRFGVEPDGHLYAAGNDPRWLATPDGYSVDPMTGERVGAEVKTTKWDLWPFVEEQRGVQPRVLTAAHATHFRDLPGAPRFWSTGYYDQMQWQMYVTGAQWWLFVYEQHDDNWAPKPKPVGTPVVVRVKANLDRQRELLQVAKELAADVEKAKVAGLPDQLGTIPAEIADDVHKVLEYRNAQAVAEAGKKAAWSKVMKYLADKPEVQYESPEAKVTWSGTTTQLEPEVDIPDDAPPSKLKAITAARDAITRAQVRIQKANEAEQKARMALSSAEARYSKAVAAYTTPRSRVDLKLTITPVRKNTGKKA